jgi:hypothetical protein
MRFLFSNARWAPRLSPERRLKAGNGVYSRRGTVTAKLVDAVRVLVCDSTWRRDDYRTFGRPTLRKDEREICRNPNPAPEADGNDPQTAGVCWHAAPIQQPSPYALRSEGAAGADAPFARISFGRSHMGISQLVETKAN